MDNKLIEVSFAGGKLLILRTFAGPQTRVRLDFTDKPALPMIWDNAGCLAYYSKWRMLEFKRVQDDYSKLSGIERAPFHVLHLYWNTSASPLCTPHRLITSDECYDWLCRFTGKSSDQNDNQAG